MERSIGPDARVTHRPFSRPRLLPLQEEQAGDGGSAAERTACAGALAPRCPRRRCGSPPRAAGRPLEAGQDPERVAWPSIATCASARRASLDGRCIASGESEPHPGARTHGLLSGSFEFAKRASPRGSASAGRASRRRDARVLTGSLNARTVRKGARGGRPQWPLMTAPMRGPPSCAHRSPLNGSAARCFASMIRLAAGGGRRAEHPAGPSRDSPIPWERRSGRWWIEGRSARGLSPHPLAHAGRSAQTKSGPVELRPDHLRARVSANGSPTRRSSRFFAPSASPGEPIAFSRCCSRRC